MAVAWHNCLCVECTNSFVPQPPLSSTCISMLHTPIIIHPPLVYTAHGIALCYSHILVVHASACYTPHHHAPTPSVHGAWHSFVLQFLVVHASALPPPSCTSTVHATPRHRAGAQHFKHTQVAGTIFQVPHMTTHTQVPPFKYQTQVPPFKYHTRVSPYKYHTQVPPYKYHTHRPE